MNPDNFMDRAISLSFEGIASGGGPFGAVVVKDGKIVGEGNNAVVPSNDPTAHAEIVAIRQACRNLENFDLSGCVIYTSCEPCPMCLAAIWWSRIEKIYYCNNRTEAAAIGFDDDAIYQEVQRPLDERQLPLIKVDHRRALDAFAEWDAKEDKVEY